MMGKTFKVVKPMEQFPLVMSFLFCFAMCRNFGALFDVASPIQ